MPYKINENHRDCPARRPWAVVKKDDGEVMGCHSSEEKAKNQMSALYANESNSEGQLLTDLEVVRATPSVAMRSAGPDDDDDSDDSNEDVLASMDVRFSPFNEWYEVDSLFEGRFLERTAPGSFKKTMQERRDAIRVLYDHGMDFQIGNKVLGPIDDLREDSDAAIGEVSLLDTSYNRDLLPGLRTGAYGASFRFRVLKEEWSEEPGKSRHNPNGLPERTIREVQLMEFGPVTFPANPAATASVRCLTDQYYEKLRSRNPEFVDELVERARSVRTHDHSPAADGTGDDDGAAPSAEEPPQALQEPNDQQRFAAWRAAKLEYKEFA